MTVEFCYLIFITIDYYTFSYFIIPQFLFRKKYITFIFATIGITALSAWLRTLVAVSMNNLYFHNSIHTDFPTLFLQSFFNIAFWVLAIVAGKMFFDRIKNQQQLELLEKEKTQNELDFLKAQINPHALFNSLNTIYGKIDKNNYIARSTLLQFSELLRYQLYDCMSEKVDLEKELDYIRNYIAFQQLRKNDNIIVHTAISYSEPHLKVAPLLFVVLIENAFKFVSDSSEQENKIEINITSNNAVIHCCVTNTIDPLFHTDTNAKGIGITNLKRRLAILYPHKHELLINETDKSYTTTLTIDVS
jgi:two-component system, LytTR family, sensor kinase